MVKIKYFLFTCAFWGLCNTPVVAQNGVSADSVFRNAVKQELKSEFEVLKKLEYPTYYLSFRVDDETMYAISSTFGYIDNVKQYRVRTLTPEIRIGSSDFDQTHLFKDESGEATGGAFSLPIQDNSNAVRTEIWKNMDGIYKDAKAIYISKQNRVQPVKGKTIKDFSIHLPKVYIEPVVNRVLDAREIENWKGLLKRLSSEFLVDQDIQAGNVALSFTSQRKYFFDSDGAEIVQNRMVASIAISGAIKSDEGNMMPFYENIYALDIDSLGSEKLLLQKCKDVVAKLVALKSAEIAEPYFGPAILSPQATGVFFHEIFGHRVEGSRMKDESDGQTYKEKKGDRILPKGFNVRFDPTQKYHQQTPLLGNYSFDDQGVAAQDVWVARNGILERFLMARTPIEGEPESNGHGRAGAGQNAVSRQSNMFVSADKTYDEADLRKMLISKCKKMRKPYGYYFKEVTGGFTNTGRYMPNSFNIMPTEVYRVYVDGRADELVRGVDLIGTPLTMFSEIEAAGNSTAVFSGHCGAESGWVPVSTVAPALLVNKIETQKTSQRFSSGTILKAPK